MSKELKFLKRNEKGKSNDQQPIYDKQDAVINGMEYSKVFTEDIGAIDDRFFENSGRSPTNNPANYQNHSNISKANPQLLKRIGELQLENT